MRPLALTMGEPAGIGPEATLKVWLDREALNLPPFFVIGNPGHLASLAADMGWNAPITVIEDPSEALQHFTNALPVLPIELGQRPIPGKPTAKNATAVRRAIEIAVDFASDGKAAAVVTNPINKQVLNEAGFGFPGHTEFLAFLSGIETPPVMMLACPALRVVPVTIHVSLREAIETLTTPMIVETARITADALHRDFGIDAPRLAVAGLNPHAGEGGHMGKEDADIVAPAIARLRALGIDANGPLPSDTMFHARAREGYDAAICMYHDQALIPIKTIDFDHGVNVTLGLPFVRTSPDHGTAFDIAGTGAANPASLAEALHMAADMAARRNAT
ncbi:MAG: 4-hydroxythreonine-4-phosphate dehydrogenase PdxA [Rhodospirillales bacterium]|nr:4-hydroxythreonine-4-phosphate dehydrogenase PdxA [Rhodospirillales bacterium]MCW8862843.1 4-hydroxythreonine-4-phosphate dehydrogenase PdxA [Rhodospirillales bacterium]MCW9002725.1 4-hydroxythreonine-4-phosphate dehydrogenase PdxA [Rhodospirillales bacterium]